MTIKSTVLRLTIGYLAVIMAISLLFSVLVFQVSSREVRGGLRRGFDVVISGGGVGGPGPVTALGPEPEAGVVQVGPNNARFETIRDEQLEIANHRLLINLGLLNLFMLLGGAGVSYWLARRHIDPIHEAMEAQARFTSDAAHELRTPLTAMKTELEVGLRDKKLTLPQAKELISSNLEEVATLTSLTNSLLRLAKVGDGEQKRHWQTVKLDDVVKQAANQLSKTAGKHQMNIDISGVYKAKVTGDSEQLKEVVVILLDNAIKYGTDGQTITLTCQQADNKVILSVTDTGIGIKASDIAHIFERFYRADQSRSKHKVTGYGLGLSLAKTIIDQHGGIISVSSDPGKGSVFTVTLPAYQASKNT